MSDMDRHAAGLTRQLQDAAELAPTDLGSTLVQLQHRGRRRVRARRAAATGAAAAVAVAVGSATVTTPWQEGGAADDRAAVSAAGPPVASGAVTSQPPADWSEEPWGAQIKTETDYEGGRLTLWFSRGPGPGPKQLSLGSRDASGRLASYGRALDVSGDDRGSGFGPGYAANGRQPRAYALFGWVTGDDVSEVTLLVAGKRHRAQTATWSEDPRVHAWWLIGPRLDEWPGKSVSPLDGVKDVVAYDSTGAVVARSATGNITRG